MKEGHEHFTTFHTPWGLYKFQVMHFRMTNAPAIFQRFINNVLRKWIDVCCVVYLDDILIYSEEVDNHTNDVTKILEALQKANLQVKLEKYHFNVKQVTFCGYEISTKGIGMSQDKIQAIQDWPKPTNVKEVLSYLGYLNFYRRFILGYSRTAIPLTNLTQKDKPFTWTQTEKNAFTKLKKDFIKDILLRHYKPDKPSQLETNSSDYAIGGVLSQQGLTSRWEPVAFYSRKLSKPELNYEIYNKELLAIVDYLRH
jgi:hypothetical protein